MHRLVVVRQMELARAKGSNGLRLTASGLREIQETVERLFATELAQSRNNPEYKADPDGCTAIFLHDSLK